MTPHGLNTPWVKAPPLTLPRVDTAAFPLSLKGEGRG